MSIEKLSSFLASTYENFPKGRTISLVVLRTTQSETIFRTEGSGEPMSSEFVQAGLENTEIIPRLVMTKRKQIAPERRKGREFLRQYNLLYNAKGDTICSLNTNAPCEMCIDCFLYGFAAGGEGAQKSRVWTEDAFSILPSTELIGDRTINALYENGTMRDETGKASTALNTSEYIKPSVHFLDIVTLKDVTADELRYAVGNILLTTRYGAVSSRVGRMDNEILGVFGGFAELPSSLELVQQVFDLLSKTDNVTLEHPLQKDSVVNAVKSIINQWTNKRGISVQLNEEELNNLVADIDTNWSMEKQEEFLARLNKTYESYRQIPAENTSKKSKGK
ncbi:type I-D CRISPR-associated protein Cas7/Csc2 [Cyanobacterium stanieri LEGE 03274]|uniref:Type I-D CRISPR-associated protein Cas7/Csc2 n=1 Tax=Cyanobacterium stanieri LEGE 03274 TaxID=1828756 RepID=A0ABR9V3D2_9CHRO|nr:type I-D CRISPR-associated protein Cas7/Csc2 [Cyanobacterium stanieri]MBE9222404.1 type I-D CRISPR-associated protein Cas7/Csc2 [Cyanobacterium stanieri LEGE 03274]